MNKSERQELILDIINKHEIDTQEELVSFLLNNGIEVTQATASRDIKELDLVKVSGNTKKYKYAQVRYNDVAVHKKFTNIFKESVISLQSALNLIVIKTVTGSANSAGAFIDKLAYPEILGTIAGDDTIFIATTNEESAKMILQKLKSYF